MKKIYPIVALLLIGCSQRGTDSSFQSREDSLRADPMVRDANCYQKSDGELVTIIVPHTIPIRGTITEAVDEMRIYIEDDRFWQERIRVIDARQASNIVLLQKEGVPLLIGEVEGYKGKLHKLRAFYEDEHTTDTLYRELDARYKGQVVGRK